MGYRDETFYWTCQRGIGWPDDYIGLDSMTRWIIEKSVGFTDVGLYRISESVRAYAFLILSSQASARSSIVGNTASALTAQSAFLNNFEDIVNRRVNIQEDIKRYQDTLSYAGINLTGYHPPPGTPGLLHRNVCPAPGLLHNRKCPGAGPIKDDVPGAGHLYQLAFKHEHC